LHNADEERAMTEHARRRLDLVDSKAWVAFAIDGQFGKRNRDRAWRFSYLA
jgi:hypothetical protein